MNDGCDQITWYARVYGKLDTEAGRTCSWHGPQLPHASDRTPIKFDAAPNAIYPTAEHHCAVLIELDLVFRCIVGGIEIVHVGRIFGGESVDPLHKGCDVQGFTVSTNGVFVGRYKVSYLWVRESHALCTGHEFVVDVLDRSATDEKSWFVGFNLERTVSEVLPNASHVGLSKIMTYIEYILIISK